MADPGGGSAEVSTYEVYILQRDRWTLHSSHKASRREDAMEEARALEGNGGVRGVKVIKEVYNPRTNASQEIAVWTSLAGAGDAKQAAAGPKAAPGRPQAAKAPEGKSEGKSEAKPSAKPAVAAQKSSAAKSQTPKPQPRPQPAKQAAAPATGSIGIVTRSLMVLLLSMGGAGLVATVVSLGMNEVGSLGIFIPTKVYGNVLAVAFGISFFLCAFVLYRSYVAPLSLVATPAGAPLQVPQARVAVTEVRRPPPASPERPPQEDKPKEDPKSKQEIKPKEEPNPPGPAKQEDNKPPPEDSRERPKSTVKPLTEGQRVVMEFAGEALSALKGVKLDAYSKFGIHLFLAGSCEVLAEDRHLGVEDRKAMLCRSIELLGTKPEMALAFAEKYEEYLNQPRHLDIYNAGRSSATRFLAKDPEAGQALSQAVESWTKRTPVQEKAPSVAVMFTDMVGSTDMTQKLGDEAAQRIVRTHNSIVRSALADYSGREIKHTGDGIMASFNVPSAAVQAAMAIQAAASLHTRTNPDLPLRLRIGINAGEAIQEDQDLFGTTVQMAARVCAAADAEQVMTSNVVKELCAGKNLRFVNKGPFTLKGFPEPLVLHEVPWKS